MKAYQGDLPGVMVEHGDLLYFSVLQETEWTDEGRIIKKNSADHHADHMWSQYTLSCPRNRLFSVSVQHLFEIYQFCQHILRLSENFS